jgi:hypothetical protein
MIDTYKIICRRKNSVLDLEKIFSIFKGSALKKRPMTLSVIGFGIFPSAAKLYISEKYNM